MWQALATDSGQSVHCVVRTVRPLGPQSPPVKGRERMYLAPLPAQAGRMDDGTLATDGAQCIARELMLMNLTQLGKGGV